MTREARLQAVSDEATQVRHVLERLYAIPGRFTACEERCLRDARTNLEAAFGLLVDVANALLPEPPTP